MILNTKNILIAGNYKEAFYKQLSDNQSHEFRFIPLEDITETDLLWADVYVGSKPCPNFTLSNIKWVHSFNAGVNNYLELEGWKEHNVLLTRTVCSFGERISEYCLSYVLQDLQYHKEFGLNQEKKVWKPKTPKMIKDQTVVIFGTGEIGQEVARTFTHFGTTVYGVSRSGKHKDYFKEVVDLNSAGTFLSKADWIISTLPLTKDTHKLFDSQFFNNMNGSVFINVGRGATVDELALIESLETGKLRYAVLDVLTQEPLPESSPLWGRQDIIITPHISAVTELNEAISCFIETLHNVEQDQPLRNRVDIEKGY